MSFLDRVLACNRYDLSHYRPFLVRHVQAGHVRDDMAEALRPYADVFEVDERAVRLNDKLRGFEERSRAVEEILKRIEFKGRMSPWRDEAYAVIAAAGGAALFAMERAAIPLFGVRAYGVHMNGYVRNSGRTYMWIGRRSRTKSTYPGLLDNTVAGGLPHGMTARECLAKECAEEAGIPGALAAKAVAVGAITYCVEMPEGLRPDVQFCYDLELPADFTPVCQDGELEGFMLMPIEEVAAIVRDTAQFKFNCNLVIIDFLIRHGFLGPEEPDYIAICRGLHQ